MSRERERERECRVCGDCSAPEPSWASVNRGVLLCAQCCSVHRSMGRHLSHVKSLHQGTWPPTLLTMMNTMAVQNANSIWEHSLLDPSSKHSKKKPQPKDSPSSKSEFIKLKHQKLAFVFRPRKDDAPCSLLDLSKQLHSSVRSANLDISLRLLVQGADPNYFNEEKGTSCLHVACRTGNSSQAELLIAWGADPNAKDVSGNTPSASAKLGGHTELADRMIETVYDVTDRLSYHLCNKKPNHKNGQHYINFDKKQSHEMTEAAKTARGKLQLLPNHLFEELVMDIYDEIDRRECEAIWVTSAIGLERFGVAFLPVNPALSAPRNQGRQKLARLTTLEMATLLKDILLDASRRQHIATLNPNPLLSSLYINNAKHSSLKQIPHVSDDEPLYDSVASDEDYAALVPIAPNEIKENKDKTGEVLFKNPHSSQISETNITKRQTIIKNRDDHNFVPDMSKTREIEVLREQLSIKDFTILDLKSKLEALQTAVDNLKSENVLLKKSVSEKRNSIAPNNSPPTRDISVVNTQIPSEQRFAKSEINDKYAFKDASKINQRPTSMYEAREWSKFSWAVNKPQFTSTDNSKIFTENCKSTITNNISSLPEANQVHKHTEIITKGIQELWGAMQNPDGHGYSFVLKANKVKLAVDALVSIFPQKTTEDISSALGQLTSACTNLESACNVRNIDNEDIENNVYMDNIRSAAYELAKAAKILVSNFPLDADNL